MGASPGAIMLGLALAAASLTACVRSSPAPVLRTAAGQPSSWEGEVRAGMWPSFTTLTVPVPGGRQGGSLKLFGRTHEFDEIAWDGARLSAGLTAANGTPIRIDAEVKGEDLVGTIRHGARELPFTFWRIPAYPTPADRLAAWRQDLDSLRARLLRADRSFSPKERQAFVRALVQLDRALPSLDDAQISVRMAEAIALADNGHTRLYLLRNRTRLRRLPVRIWLFTDGPRVVRAIPAQRELLGCRIDAIAGVPIAQVRAAVDRMHAGTGSWKTYMAAYVLTSPEALHGAGILDSLERVQLTLSDCAASGSRTLIPLPLQKSDAPVEAWWDLSPRFPAPAGSWMQVFEGRSELPLYLQSPANYWFRFVPEEGALYVQYNRAEDQQDLTTRAFGTRLLAELHAQRPRAFILDLRFNTGGNLELSEDLMNQLIRETEGMRRYVITGRATFSAGITAAVTWREAGEVITVGEPVGDELDFWAEGGNIRLPNSGYDAHFANALHSYSPAPCLAMVACLDRNVTSLGPDRPTSSSWAEYSAGRDPAMELILNDLRALRPSLRRQ